MLNNKIISVAIVLLSLILLIQSQFCPSPGFCISIYDCPQALALLQQQYVSDATKSTIRGLQCTNIGARFPVCCSDDIPKPTSPIISTTIKPTTDTSSSNTGGVGTDAGDVIPKKGICGVSPLGNRIYGGNATELGEFPWMALLQYENPNKAGVKSFSCGGSLINSKYILTAAHCLVGDIETAVGKLVSVRLGEYDLSSDNDCVEDECGDPVIDIPVEKVIPHEAYDQRSRNKINDIGLVRLSQAVKYTEYIKPVCLPSVVQLQRSVANENLFSSGWGRTLLKKQSTIKLKVKLPFVDEKTCIEKYATIRTDISDTQLCAGGGYAEDTCDGDSGGPLMKTVSSLWTIEGVVSFGRGCGLENWPAVYTRVSSFEDWIRNNLEP